MTWSLIRLTTTVFKLTGNGLQHDLHLSLTWHICKPILCKMVCCNIMPHKAYSNHSAHHLFSLKTQYVGKAPWARCHSIQMAGQYQVTLFSFQVLTLLCKWDPVPSWAWYFGEGPEVFWHLRNCHYHKFLIQCQIGTLFCFKAWRDFHGSGV